MRLTWLANTSTTSSLPTMSVITVIALMIGYLFLSQESWQYYSKYLTIPMLIECLKP